MLGRLAHITLLKSWSLVLFGFYGLRFQKIKPKHGRRLLINL